MIVGIERALPGEESRRELLEALTELLDGSGGASFEGEQSLKRRVHRLRFTVPAGERSVVVKRLHLGEARRNELAERSWLPAVGLDACGPGLLDVAGGGGADWVWHIYEDLGDGAIESREADGERVAAAVRLIAAVHSRFESHPLLAEGRAVGGSLGIAHYASNVLDAVRVFHSLQNPGVALAPDQRELLARLLERLTRLLDDEPRRRRALEACGGPETLLHGDLWTSNTFVLESADGYRARLIDWDHAGVGPASYDLSTFLLRFPPAQRPGIVELYRGSRETDGWSLPGAAELNLLFETAELGRYANCAAWPAHAIAKNGAPWAFPMLAEVERWFESLQPVLPPDPAGGETT